MRRVVLLGALWLIAAIGVRAEDWPQFRGPTGQGHSREVGLPLEWSETRNVAWKIPVDGSGWSSPVVSNGRVWVTAARPAGRSSVSLRLLAYDVSNGHTVVDAEVFKVSTSTPLNPKNSRASPTPIVDGDRVYVHFGPDGTAALTTAGAILWTRKLSYEPQHGGGGSPALYRDLLIVNCDGNGAEAYVIALDARTGQTRWKKDRRRPSAQAYSTPLIIQQGDRDLAISVGAFRTVAYDPATGEEVWRVGYDDGFSNVPRPVFGAGLVFIATGFNTPALIAVRPDGRGDVTRTHVAWTSSRGAPYTPSPLVVDSRLYYVSDTGVLTCVDAPTGRILWQQRLPGNYSASPVFADGRIYYSSEEGVTTVIGGGPTFERLATNTLDEPTLASIAVSGRALFIRTEGHLYKVAARLDVGAGVLGHRSASRGGGSRP
jgi:outer membrane protein assembly factor BamB